MLSCSCRRIGTAKSKKKLTSTGGSGALWRAGTTCPSQVSVMRFVTWPDLTPLTLLLRLFSLLERFSLLLDNSLMVATAGQLGLANDPSFRTLSGKKKNTFINRHKKKNNNNINYTINSTYNRYAGSIKYYYNKCFQAPKTSSSSVTLRDIFNNYFNTMTDRRARMMLFFNFHSYNCVFFLI